MLKYYKLIYNTMKYCFTYPSVTFSNEQFCCPEYGPAHHPSGEVKLISSFYYVEALPSSSFQYI